MVTVPCGVVTHAGLHTATLCYTNNTVIATTSTHVAWPSLAIAVPTRYCQPPCSHSLGCDWLAGLAKALVGLFLGVDELCWQIM